MSFPKAIFTVIGLSAVAVFVLGAIVGVCERIGTRPWMGQSDWAGRIFVIMFLLPVSAMVVWVVVSW